MPHLSKKLILLILSLSLVVGVQTSCSSTYILKKLIFSEIEENEKFGENENLESTNWQFVSNSEINFYISGNLLRYLNQNNTHLLQNNPLVLTSPPNA
jgi:hypothetical protein